MIKKVLKVLIVIILLVWAIGYFLFWGVFYGALVMGLIFLALVILFIGIITDDDFL